MNGRIYVACTNNTDRGKPGKEGPTEPNPRAANKDGHVVEIAPEPAATTRAGTFALEPAAHLRRPGHGRHLLRRLHGPVSPISCPDNVAFDSAGNLWISTDGQPSRARPQRRPLQGAGRRTRARAGAAVPGRAAGAETCGPVIHDRDGSVFVAVQHPGEEGRGRRPQ